MGGLPSEDSNSHVWCGGWDLRINLPVRVVSNKDGLNEYWQWKKNI